MTTPTIKTLEACGLKLTYRGRLTDAGSQLVDDDGGNWTGSDLRGKAGQYAASYVGRRRALAAAAARLGLGKLVQLDGRSHNRIVWQWTDDALDIAQRIVADAGDEDCYVAESTADKRAA